MPSIDRKPRLRRRTELGEPDTHESILRGLHAAIGDPEAWAAMRQRAIRCWSGSGRLTTEQAAAIFDAYGKRPHLLPMLPPKG